MRILGVAGCVTIGAGSAQAQYVCDNGSSPLTSATLTAGENYFRIGGATTFFLGTNPYAPTKTMFRPLLDAAAVNEKVVRVHLHSLFQRPTSPGAIDPIWVSNWHDVLCDAQQRGLYVLPVLDVWSNWNQIAKPQVWETSIYNAANINCGGTSGITCGNATLPGELLQPGQTQTDWLNYIAGAVAAFKEHTNIIGWEIFSELDNIVDTNGFATNQTPVPCAFKNNEPLPKAVCLVDTAADVIHTADPGRPVTASLSNVAEWPALSQSDIDFLEIHPYTDVPPIVGASLDESIIIYARQQRMSKPVFIGESGLDRIFPSANALTLNPDGWIGINHAIWAGAVTGTMNARHLWVEDGYDWDAIARDYVDLCPLNLPQFALQPECMDVDLTTRYTLHQVYANASLPVKSFLANVDYSGFEPLTMTSGTGNLMGAALGSDVHVIGWVRDVLSVYDPAAADPYWPQRPLNGETITVTLTGHSVDWRVDFYDTLNGARGTSVYAHQAADGSITFPLPEVGGSPEVPGSIAFQIVPEPPIQVDIEIRPRRRINLIVPVLPQPVPVVVFGSSTFDVGAVNVGSVEFGPAGALVVDSDVTMVDGDLYPDLVLLFQQDQTGLRCGQRGALLQGETTEGRTFFGFDNIVVVGPGCHP
jgi:hypothetical protein